MLDFLDIQVLKREWDVGCPFCNLFLVTYSVPNRLSALIFIDTAVVLLMLSGEFIVLNFRLMSGGFNRLHGFEKVGNHQSFIIA